MSGTSMASPIVAGMVGQLLILNSDETVFDTDAIKEIITDDEYSYSISYSNSTISNAFTISCDDLSAAASGTTTSTTTGPDMTTTDGSTPTTTEPTTTEPTTTEPTTTVTTTTLTSDPNCTYGIINSKGDVCCPSDCSNSQCGGSGCGSAGEYCCSG